MLSWLVAPAGSVPTHANNKLAGPAVLSGGYPSQGSSLISRPLITSGTGYRAAKPGTPAQGTPAGLSATSGAALTAAAGDAGILRTAATGSTSAGAINATAGVINATPGVAAATAAALAPSQQRYRPSSSTYPGAFSNAPGHMGPLTGTQAAGYGRAAQAQLGQTPGAFCPGPADQTAVAHTARSAAMSYGPHTYMQTKTPYSAPLPLGYPAHAQIQAQTSYGLQSTYQYHAANAAQLQRQSSAAGPYGAQQQLPYASSSGLQQHYSQQHRAPAQLPYQQPPYATAAPPYATAAAAYAAATPLQPPRPPPLTVEQFTFGRLAPQPENAIDIISEDAVLPTFPLKKMKPKKRKYAGLEAFAAEVWRHKRLALEARQNVLQSQIVKKLGRPIKVNPSPIKGEEKLGQNQRSPTRFGQRPDLAMKSYDGHSLLA